MARRLDDRQGLAKVLVRSYWSRDVREFAQTLDMLAEARDLAHGVGDDELEIDAREWRVAGLIALGDLDRAHEEHERGALHRRTGCASRSRCTSPSTTPRRSRCATGASRMRRRRRTGPTSGRAC